MLTLNLRPELEASIISQARAIGVTPEDYLRNLLEKELPPDSAPGEQSEASGMVWENGLFVYRTGRPLPAHVVDEAIRHSRETRAREILGDIS